MHWNYSYHKMTHKIFLQEILDFEVAADDYRKIKEHIEGYYIRARGCKQDVERPIIFINRSVAFKYEINPRLDSVIQSGKKTQKNKTQKL